MSLIFVDELDLYSHLSVTRKRGSEHSRVKKRKKRERIRAWYTREQHKYLIRSGIWTSTETKARPTIHTGVGGTVGYELTITNQEDQGKGLMARKFYPKGTVITQYDGFYIDRKDADEMGDQATHVYSMGRLVISGLKDREDAKGFGGGSFVNHSEDPNAKYTHDNLGGVYLKALRDIKTGDFITTKYGSRYIRVKNLFTPSNKVFTE